jgi:uncharacterized protein (DUF362 family)
MSTKVAILQDSDRARAIPKVIDLLGLGDSLKDKSILLKPNFNTADPYPASTHNDTLRSIIGKLKGMGASDIKIGERSGPVDTADVMRDKGIPPLCEEMGVGLINFDALPEEQWKRFTPEGTSWRNGFLFARPALEADAVVSTCCLKTHAYGGGITISLKLSIGMLNRVNMTELHTSFLSQKKMIADTNVPYSPALIVMDALDVFTDNGPFNGPIKSPGLIVAGTDRIAIDVVGMAIFKAVGSNDHIMNTPAFKHPQIARAIELGLGIKSAEEIEFLTDDAESRYWAEKIKTILLSNK